MPHTESAKKRLRQSKQRNLRNRSTKHAIKTQMRRVLAAIDAKDAAAASREFALVSKKIDKAAARQIMHRNAASRTKSRLAVRVQALATPAK